MSGHIEKNKNGTYTVILELGKGIDGKRKRPKQTFNKYTEAKHYLNDFENQASKGIIIEPSNITFGEWIVYWENNYVKNTCERTTELNYRRDWS